MTPIAHIRVSKPLRFDTLIAVLLLQAHGEKLFPGVATADVVYDVAPEQKDTTFDMQQCIPLPVYYKTLTYHVADRLGVKDVAEALALIDLVARAQTTQRSTVTMIQAVIDANQDTPTEALRIAKPLISGSLTTSTSSTTTLEVYKKLQESKQITRYPLKKGDSFVRVCSFASPTHGLARASVDATDSDIAIQEIAAGKIVLAATANIDLNEAVKIIRVEEGRKTKVEGLPQIPKYTFMNDGVVDPITEWLYDKTANTLSTTTATKLSLQELVSALVIGVGGTVWEKKCPPTGCRGAACYFYDFGLQRCRAREIAQISDDLNSWKLEPQGHGKEAIKTHNN